ncbi:MAG: hypothetical protein J5I92_15090 [Thiogranum sp.]|nr:hypothetical protein [Thiogranum sp.]
MDMNIMKKIATFEKKTELRLVARYAIAAGFTSGKPSFLDGVLVAPDVRSARSIFVEGVAELIADQASKVLMIEGVENHTEEWALGIALGTLGDRNDHESLKNRLGVFYSPAIAAVRKFRESYLVGPEVTLQGDEESTTGSDCVRLRVGERYPLPLPGPEGATAEFLRKGESRLIVALNDLKQREAVALRRGSIYAGLLARDGAILLLFAVCDATGLPVLSFQCPFDARLIGEDDLAIPCATSLRTRLYFAIHGVDRTTGIVKALRGVTFAPTTTSRFLEAARAQKDSSDSGEEVHRQWRNIDATDLLVDADMAICGR